MKNKNHTIIDRYGRPLEYLRLSVTDRCNLRCTYCLPENADFVPKNQLFTYEELQRIVRLFSELGVTKVRITGGEPFVRKDIGTLLEYIRDIQSIETLNITTNGTLLGRHLESIQKAGIDTVNLSLDTLNPQRFYKITRRDSFSTVMRTFHTLLEMGIRVKINAVIVEGLNTEDIIPLAQLTKNYPVHVRFIEEMPFNGLGKSAPTLNWDYRKIKEVLKTHYPGFRKLEHTLSDTATMYQIPNHEGYVGIIPAYSRTFCGTCNRIRLTATGMIKTCLYDDGKLNLRHLMRAGRSDDELKEILKSAFSNREKDGFEAEKNRSMSVPVSESMSTIGG